MATLLIQTALSVAINWAIQALTQEGREGPRLDNLKLQTSEFGKTIPIPFGSVRLPGIVEWTTDLIEHKNSSGGKGSGPSVTTYSYSASFSCKVCEGPVVGVKRIWADQTVIWEAGSTDEDLPDVPVTVYLGTDDQAVDPTMEAILGVGNVSANRGYCYCVFADWDLGKYGNRIPQLNFEVYTKGNTGTIPWRYATFDPAQGESLNMQFFAAAADANGLITATFVKRAGIDAQVWVTQYYLDGTVATPPGAFSVPESPSILFYGTPRNSPGGPFLFNGPGPADFFAYALAYTTTPGDMQFIRGEEWHAGDDLSFILFPSNENSNSSVVIAGNILYSSQTGGASYLCGSGINTGWPFGTDLMPWGVVGAPSAFVLGYSTTGDDALYALQNVGGGCRLWRFGGPRGSFYWDETVVAGYGATLQARGNFFVWMDDQGREFIVLKYRIGSAASVRLVQIHEDESLSNYPDFLSTGQTDGFTIYMGNGIGLDPLGTFSLIPPVAAEPVILGVDIVGPISVRCGLDPARFNVDQLTDLVDGFAIIDQDAGRAQLTPLQMAYFWDAVESGGVIQFVKRGGPITVTIPDDDMAAHVTGTTDPPLITVKRQQEVDLPANLNVNYLDYETDYQKGTQYARRLVTRSQANVAVELAIVMLASKASQIAWAQLFALWMEREKFTVQLPRSYWFYEPTDTFSAHGYVFRITNKSDIASGVVQFEGVATNSLVWVQGPTPAPGDGFTPTTPNPQVPTVALLLDIPMIADTDGNYNPYCAAGPNADVTWGGYTLFKSTDAGGNYVQVGASSIKTVMGTADDILAPFLGGNVFDTVSSVTVTIGAGGGDFESFSMDAVLGGAGFYLLGDELIQAMTADEVSAGVWTLTNLLRGRRGTEWAMFGHAVGERAVFFPALNVTNDLDDLGLERLYKAVTQGKTLGSTTAVAFTNNGAAARPYAPVAVAGAPIDPFDGTVQINWQRRTRRGGAWSNFADVPLSEAVERYIVQIWNATYTLVARIITVDNAQTTTYTEAMQVVDFGAIQENIYVTVGQVGAYQLGTQTAATVPGLGSGDDAPLDPVPPYNNAPPSPPGGCALTQINQFIDWNAPVAVFADLNSSNVWVLSFTTPASPVGAVLPIGSLIIAETSPPAVARVATLSLEPCGAPLGGLAGSTSSAPQPVFNICMMSNPNPAVIPTLLPSTTYYVSVTSATFSSTTATLNPPTD
jgi:hypothetical protein